MDTPVETDHALLRNRRWDVARAAYSPLKAACCSLVFDTMVSVEAV
jgi:hypothetical protein